MLWHKNKKLLTGPVLCVRWSGPRLAQRRRGHSMQAMREGILHRAQKGSCSTTFPSQLFQPYGSFLSEQWRQMRCRFVLQHHCRNCGDIYCNSCSSNELALPSYPRPVRVCDACHALLLQRSSSTGCWHWIYKVLMFKECQIRLFCFHWCLKFRSTTSSV